MGFPEFCEPLQLIIKAEVGIVGPSIYSRLDRGPFLWLESKVRAVLWAWALNLQVCANSGS